MNRVEVGVYWVAWKSGIDGCRSCFVWQKVQVNIRIILGICRLSSGEGLRKLFA
jgi:hypothetical protein